MKTYTRKLEVTVSGRWYLVLTILIGVIAIVTGNNAIYVMESLLLSGFILSGVLSEQMITGIELEIIRGTATAHDPSSNHDQIRITNSKNRTLYAIEIGEWNSKGESAPQNKRFSPLTWISQIEPHQTLVLPSEQTYEKRGLHSWEAIAIATRYPFGFAKKIRFKLEAGEKLVWPAIGQIMLNRRNHLTLKEQRLSGIVIQEDEIRPMLAEDDYRSIVWTLSNKGLDPVVRLRKSERPTSAIVLDLRVPKGEDFEDLVSQVARRIYFLPESQSSALTLLRSEGKNVFYGKISILNQLATVQAELPENSSKEGVFS